MNCEPVDQVIDTKKAVFTATSISGEIKFHKRTGVSGCYGSRVLILSFCLDYRPRKRRELHTGERRSYPSSAFRLVAWGSTPAAASGWNPRALSMFVPLLRLLQSSLSGLVLRGAAPVSKQDSRRFFLWKLYFISVSFANFRCCCVGSAA